MKIITNLPTTGLPSGGCSVVFSPLTLEGLKGLLQGKLEWLLGDDPSATTTAQCLSQSLSITIPAVRGKVFVNHGESAVIIKTQGAPLPRGSTSLPAGCRWHITLAEVL